MTKKFLFLLGTVLSFSAVFAQSPAKSEIPLLLTSTDPNAGTFQDIEYTGVRIGEYYWTNSNLNHDIPRRQVYWYDQNKFQWVYGSYIFGHETMTPVTQATLDRYMPCHLMDPSVYQLENISDFKKYYGSYYNLFDIQYMGGSNTYGEYRAGYAEMREGKDKKLMPWRIPSQGDFAQLFAMCHVGGTSLGEQDVEFALGAKPGDNPLATHLASNGQVVGWFDGNNNKYGFNMMPGGGRISVAGDRWFNGLNPSGGWVAQYGDLYHLFQAEYFHTMEEDGTIYCVSMHDRITFYRAPTQKWQNARYCRRLTPQELGYELYINADLTDIKKLAPNAPAPAGYTVLPNGYLRGFYVLHILDNPNPTMTVADLVELTQNTITNNTSDEGPGYPVDEIVEPKHILEDEVPLVLTSTDPNAGTFQDIKYTGVRIGEYYWTNSNLNHDIPRRQVYWYDQNKFQWVYGSYIFGHETMTPVTQATLDRYMPCYLMNPSVYQLENISDFKKYYGSYYNYIDIQYMGGSNTYGEYRAGYAEMREGKDKKLMPWRIPSQGDFAQLFAMCLVGGTSLGEQDVEFALGAKPGDNPLATHLASNGQVVGWFDGNNNKYGFNMMPGGGRISVAGDRWHNGLNPDGWLAQYGDLYHLFQAEYFHTMEEDGTIYSISIHDYITFYRMPTQKWQNARYCRRLTPQELGYELYINADLTDIKKLAPNAPAPAGYTVLPNGYLRGFYVLHILDNPNPIMTVADLVELTRNTMIRNTSKEGLGYPVNEIVTLPAPSARKTLSVESSETSTNNEVTIFPNPVEDMLNIESPHKINSVNIFNTAGSKVKELTNVSGAINVSDLAPGTYIVKIATSKNIVTDKILKK